MGLLPDVVSGYKKMLLKCMGDSLGNIYLHQYKGASSLIAMNQANIV
jgi:hypothetical protein